MKSALAVLLLLVSAYTLSSCAQANTPEETSSASTTVASVINEDIETVVSQLERDWVTAIVRKDVAGLDRLLADEFNGTSPTAHTFTKRAAIDDLKSGTYVVESMDLDEVSVNSYGDVAVAFASQEEKSRYNGKDISGHYHYTDVWVKRDGRWQVVASHGSRFDTGHPAS